MPRVVLFKTQSVVNDTDAYHQAFAQLGFEVQYIPVLQETFHVNELTNFISSHELAWSGVIITSKRGAEGWVQAAQSSENASSSTSWNNLQLFTVGSTCLEVLSEANPTLPEQLRLDTTRAIQAKSASTLLPLILRTSDTENRPLLLIRGDKSTNELQQGLTEAGRAFIETTVYSTTRRPSLAEDIEALMRDVENREKATWLAFFSPSSAEMILDDLSALKRLNKVGSGSRLRIAAIGETTAKYLVDYGLKIHAIAEKPTAEGLVSAIQASGACSETDSIRDMGISV